VSAVVVRVRVRSGLAGGGLRHVARRIGVALLPDVVERAEAAPVRVDHAVLVVPASPLFVERAERGDALVRPILGLVVGVYDLPPREAQLHLSRVAIAD